MQENQRPHQWLIAHCEKRSSPPDFSSGFLSYRSVSQTVGCPPPSCRSEQSFDKSSVRLARLESTSRPLLRNKEMFETVTCTWIVAVIVAIFSFIKWYISRNDHYWKKKGVPHAPRASYYSTYKEVKEKGLAEIVKTSLRPYGRRVIGTFEFSTPTVTVADPDILRDIFVKDFHIFPFRR
ncbi:cytochrome P450 3A11, partial [Trichonephila clavata]